MYCINIPVTHDVLARPTGPSSAAPASSSPRNRNRTEQNTHPCLFLSVSSRSCFVFGFYFTRYHLWPGNEPLRLRLPALTDYCQLAQLTMSASLTRSQASSSAPRAIKLLSCRPHASNAAAAVSNRYAAIRGLCYGRKPASSLAPSGFRRVAPSIRSKSTVAQTAEVTRRSSAFNFLVKTFAYTGLFIVSSGVAVVAFFVYDASTYRDDPSAVDIPVSELALHPRRGGPKNLPIAEALLGDQDTEEMAEQKDKPRLVILGTGWGSISLLKQLNPGDYHVTVVSPTNYFLFTPMLPSATVGTLGLRSLVEPVRRIIRRVNGHFIKAAADDVDFSDKLVEISQKDDSGQKQSFYLPYDKLVIGVGMFDNDLALYAQ